MKKLLLLGVFMLSCVSFANKARESVVENIKLETFVKKQQVLSSIENVNILLYCNTETYTHTKVVSKKAIASMDQSVAVTETITITITTGACETCMGVGSPTITCWGSRFPPLNW